MSFNTANTILPNLKGWCELRTALRKQQLCRRTSDEIRSRIRKTVTTYSRVRPTRVLASTLRFLHLSGFWPHTSASLSGCLFGGPASLAGFICLLLH